MKKLILIGLLSSLLLGATDENDKDIKEIKKTIVAFAKAGDQNDAEALNKYIDGNYRIVMNRLFGSKTVSVMSRDIYLEKIRSKEFGGDDRSLTIENIIVNGTVASAKVIFKGKKASYTSLINLVKSESNKWKLVSDIPMF